MPLRHVKKRVRHHGPVDDALAALGLTRTVVAVVPSTAWSDMPPSYTERDIVPFINCMLG
jgi:hypothetical protein